MDMTDYFFDSLMPTGVVPVFVNAGAALLPAILGGLVSFLALLLKPRELLRACIRRPWVPLLVIGIGVGGYYGINWLFPHGEDIASEADDRREVSSDKTSWSDVALELIQKEENDWKGKWLEEVTARRELEARVAELELLLTKTGEPANLPVEGEATDLPTPTQARIYRGDSARCGYGGGGAPTSLLPFWDYNDDFTMYLSSPLVVGDKIYGASCVLDPPNNYGAVFCLTATEGKELWYADVLKDPISGREVEFNAFFSSPAITADGKHLVIGQGLHEDKDCKLLCFETDTGKVKWSVPTTLHIEGSPAIEGDLVVAGAGAIEGPDNKPKGDPGFVFAVRISDGTLLWKHPVIDPESSPVIDNGIVYIGSGVGGNAVVALRTESDEELKAKGLKRLVWKTETPHSAGGPVTLLGDLVLIGCGNANYVFTPADPKGVVLALDRKTGKIRWSTDVANTVLGAIAARDDLVVCTVLSGEVIALDPNAKGKILWRRKVRERSMLKASPALTESLVYVLTHDGYLCLLDAKSGEVIEEHYVNAPTRPGELGLSTSAPFVADGKVFVGSETGGIRCYIGKDLR